MYMDNRWDNPRQICIGSYDHTFIRPPPPYMYQDYCLKGQLEEHLHATNIGQVYLFCLPVKRLLSYFSFIILEFFLRNISYELCCLDTNWAQYWASPRVPFVDDYLYLEVMLLIAFVKSFASEHGSI